MIEAGQAEEADNFVFRVLVAPRAASHVLQIGPQASAVLVVSQFEFIGP
jgi:hypothetical protein